MKNFEQPVVEIIVYESIDVVTTSFGIFDDNGFNNNVVKP